MLTSPIKGTAHRPDPTPAAEAARETLLASAKDGAESAMIVDLMGNDVGQVCVPGSVRAAEPAGPAAHLGVWDLVPGLVGQLAPGVSHGSLEVAAFPAGSITGAPKVQAMEIVRELGPVEVARWPRAAHVVGPPAPRGALVGDDGRRGPAPPG